MIAVHMNCEWCGDPERCSDESAPDEAPLFLCLFCAGEQMKQRAFDALCEEDELSEAA